MYLRLCLLCFFFLLQWSGAQAQTQVIKLVAGDAFPPLMWDDYGVANGMAVEIGKEVFTRAGFVVVVETCPWVRCQKIAEKEGAFLVGFSMNEERKAKFLFSDTYMHDDIVIVTKKGKEFSLSNPEEFKGKVIGAQPGVGFGPHNEGMRQGMIIETDSNDIARVKKIMANRIDGGFFSLGRAGIQFSAEKAGYSMNDFSILPTVISKDPNYFATGVATPGAKEILAKVNAAIKELKKDGTIARIKRTVFK